MLLLSKIGLDHSTPEKVCLFFNNRHAYVHKVHYAGGYQNLIPILLTTNTALRVAFIKIYRRFYLQQKKTLRRRLSKFTNKKRTADAVLFSLFFYFAMNIFMKFVHSKKALNQRKISLL